MGKLLKLLSLITLTIVLASPVFGLSKDLQRLLNRGVHYYDPKNDSSDQCQANFSGSNNQEIAFNFFRSKGLTDVQSAAIVGNLRQESGPDIDPRADNGSHRGIAQWDYTIRWANLLKFAQAHNRDEFTIELQLDFIWFEVTGQPPTGGVAGNNRPGALTELKKKDTLEGADGAVATWLDLFEGASGQGLDDRIRYANEVLAKYGGKKASGSSCSGFINTEGYSFPLEGTKNEIGIAGEDGSLPCTAGPKGCHHDRTPAFDLIIKPGGNATLGRKVYAIHDGTIHSLNSGYNGAAQCYSIEFLQTNSADPKDDGWYYWYGHIVKPTVKEGDKVRAGTQIAEVGPTICAKLTLPHLHIDRGSPQGALGGYDDHRDPGIIDLINSLYESLPK